LIRPRKSLKTKNVILLFIVRLPIMKKKFLNLSLVVFVALILISFSGCNKDCYNPSLENEFKDKACTTDCPGVTGCDGKEYCNECEANKKGVAVDN
jgi:hypothetical protein